MPGRTHGEQIADIQAWRSAAQLRLDDHEQDIDATRDETRDHDRRLIRLEEGMAEAKAARTEWGKRAWGLAQGLLLLAAGGVLGYLAKR